jgi:hypothetical protein
VAFAAYEFLASEYGWSVAHVRASLTDEQLVRVYLEPAQERVEERSRAAFDDMVEATRVGYIIARDRKAFHRWTNRRQRVRPKRGLTGHALEQAVLNISRLYPDNVIVGAA